MTLDEEVRAAKQKLQERRQFSDAAVTAWIKQEEAESTYGAVVLGSLLLLICTVGIWTRSWLFTTFIGLVGVILCGVAFGIYGKWKSKSGRESLGPSAAAFHAPERGRGKIEAVRERLVTLANYDLNRITREVSDKRTMLEKEWSRKTNELVMAALEERLCEMGFPECSLSLDYGIRQWFFDDRCKECGTPLCDMGRNNNCALCRMRWDLQVEKKNI